MVTLNSGEIINVFSVKDILDNMAQNYSVEASEYLATEIQQLEEGFDHTGTDLDAYEAQLDEQQSAFCDIQELVTDMTQYVQSSKRLDRRKLEDGLNSIYKIINNTI